MFVLVAITMMACILGIIGRSNVRMAPAAVRRNVTSTEPKRIVWVIKADRAMESIMLDAKYTPTGGTGAGNLNSLMLEFRGYRNGALKLGIRKESWVATTKFAFSTFLNQGYFRKNQSSGTTSLKYYDDDTFTVGTTQGPLHSYFKIYGPFEPGTWKFVLDLDKTTNVWTGSTGFTGDFGLTPFFFIDEQPGRYVALLGSKRYTDTEIQIPSCTGYYVEVVANIEKIMHGAKNIQGTEYEYLQYGWNEMVDVQWNASVQTDLAAYPQEGFVPVVVKYTTSTSSAYAYIIAYKPLPPKKVVRKESAAIVPPAPYYKVDDEEAETVEVQFPGQ